MNGNTRHGHAIRGKHSSTHQSWLDMTYRCTNPRSRNWNYYGGRGIVVCDRWRQFENFLADMGENPKGLQLDRIDNNGNYEPGNCRWATRSEQHRNKRNNRLLTLGVRTQCRQAWADELGISIEALWRRLSRRGWSIEKALTTPSMRKQA